MNQKKTIHIIIYQINQEINYLQKIFYKIILFNIVMFYFIAEANISLSYFFLTLFIVSKLRIQLNLLLFTYVIFFPLSFFQFRKISPLLQVVSCSVVSESLRPHGLQLARHLCPWTSPGKNTGVHRQSLLQGDLPKPGMEPGSPIFQEYSLSSEICTVYILT